MYTKKLCQQYGFRPNLIFALKSRLLNYPLSTIGMLFVLFVSFYAYLLRLFEAPYYRTLPEDDPDHRRFDNFFISVWLVIITITTVGYGDVYAQSNPGKLVSCCIAISGSFLMALVVTIVTSQVNLSPKQQLALTHMQLSKKAAETIQKMLKFFKVKKRVMLINALRHMTNTRATG